MKEYFFTPLLNSNYIEFFKKREVFTKSFLVITLLTFITVWSLSAKENINQLSFWSIIFLSPIYCFCFYMGVYQFLFKYNWFYVIYFISSLVLFSITIIKLNEILKYTVILYELLFFILMSIMGCIIPIALALPFKLLNHLLFDTETIYYSQNLTKEIADEFYNKKKKSNIELKIAEKINKYDTMNETQLQVELINAIAEERFEDAELIKKALEKYR